MIGSTSPDLAEWYSNVFLPFVDGLTSQAGKDTMNMMAAMSAVHALDQNQAREIAARSSLGGGGKTRNARGVSEMDEEAIKQFLGHYRRMESKSHNEALKEVEDLRKKGKNVQVYTGGRGMKVIMNGGDDYKEDVGNQDDDQQLHEVKVDEVGEDEEEEEELVDEMGDEYI